ncbi:flavodoxin domain-containing protein [Streptomyces sp. NPDC052114]|uniref:flavodoxin domain-containing protein n=1 Tax=unclassified Streptomyces TaxID=2593676 RepID=UPI003428292D
MTGRMLVAYATKNGSTAEIAGTITRTLREEGIETDLRPVVYIGGIEEYDGVVLGSPLYAGRWHRDARRFARRRRRALAAKEVWLFSSGPLDASASERDIAPVPAVHRMLTAIGAHEHVTFGGCLKDGAKGHIARMILRSGKGGDFRDFQQIGDWSRRVAAALKGELAGRAEGY